MTSSKITKRALLSSVLAVLMCVAMLVGTTFAWFTDTASTAVNKIVAGNLDIELSYKNSSTDGKFVKADKDTPVFKDGALWEPGHVEYVVLKVNNAGSLALKYKLGINIANEVGSTNVIGDPFKLSDYIHFAVLDGDKTEGDFDRDSLVNAAGNGAVLNEGYTVEDHMAAGDEKIITLVVWMPTTVGNEANHMTGAAAPSIDLGISVLAAQYTYEKDSFGDDYDAKAEYDEEKVITVNDATELTAAIKSAEGGETIRLGADVETSSKTTVNKELAIDLAGFRLSGTAQYTLQLSAGANVTVTDSSDGAAGVIANTYSGSAEPATVDLQGAGAVFTLESGVVESNAKDNLYTIAISSSKKAACTVNINGGTVSNPDGHTKSRAIVASNGMTVNINGGTISGGVYALDAYAGSVSNINGGKLFANGTVSRNDEYGTSYAIHAKGEAQINIGSASAATTPNVKGIKFESSGVKTELPTINLVKGEITNPIYSLEQKYNYDLFKLGITADAPVTFTDNTASYFLADDLQMVQNGDIWIVTAK